MSMTSYTQNKQEYFHALNSYNNLVQNLYTNEYETVEECNVKNCLSTLAFSDEQLCATNLIVNPYLRYFEAIVDWTKIHTNNSDESTIGPCEFIIYFLPSKIALGKTMTRQYCYHSNNSFEHNILKLDSSFSINSILDSFHLNNINNDNLREKLILLIRYYMSKLFVIPIK